MATRKLGIVTVHGTGDTAEGPDGEKWFQTRSTFAQRLKARLARQGLEAEILPFLWSGANSAQEREKGAQKLAKAIKKHAGKYGPVHVIGHSHGGNVANEAARILRWQPRFDFLSFLFNPFGFLFRRNRIASLTTVGTPFFRSRLSAAESFGGAAFLLMLIVSTITLAFVGLILAVALTLPPPEPLPEYVLQAPDVHRDQIEAYEFDLSMREFARVAGPIFPFFVLPLVFMYPIAFSGLARILRLRRKRNERAVVHSIWHPNDEAIAFLQRIENLPLEPFPNGAFWRGSRTAGIVWGVRITLWVFLFGLVLAIAGAFGLQLPGWALTPSSDLYASLFDERLEEYANGATVIIGLVICIGAIVGMPIIFGAVYVLTRLLIYGATLELGLRRALNKSIGGVLKGIAFGRDGDEDVGDVATVSHCHGANCAVLNGEVAERMQKNSAAAADALIQKYRWSLLSVGAESNAALEKLATDAMTWDSLIHTTYFDQPEIADMIGDYIAARAQGEEEKAQAPATPMSVGAAPAPA